MSLTLDKLTQQIMYFCIHYRGEDSSKVNEKITTSKLKDALCELFILDKDVLLQNIKILEEWDFNIKLNQIQEKAIRDFVHKLAQLFTASSMNMKSQQFDQNPALRTWLKELDPEATPVISKFQPSAAVSVQSEVLDGIAKPMIEAVRGGDVGFLKSGLASSNKAVFINIVNQLNLLTLAIEADKYPVIQFLIQCGVDVNKYNEKGHTPLISAILSQSLPIFELLLQHGAFSNVSEKDKPENKPLMLIVRSGRADFLRVLADKRNIDVNVERSAAEETLLEIAIKNQQVDMVSELLRLGASTEFIDDANYSALDIAKKSGNKEIIATIKSYIRKRIEANECYCQERYDDLSLEPDESFASSSDSEPLSAESAPKSDETLGIEPTPEKSAKKKRGAEIPTPAEGAKIFSLETKDSCPVSLASSRKKRGMDVSAAVDQTRAERFNADLENTHAQLLARVSTPIRAPKRSLQSSVTNGEAKPRILTFNQRMQALMHS